MRLSPVDVHVESFLDNPNSDLPYRGSSDSILTDEAASATLVSGRALNALPATEIRPPDALKAAPAAPAVGTVDPPNELQAHELQSLLTTLDAPLAQGGEILEVASQKPPLPTYNKIVKLLLERDLEATRNRFRDGDESAGEKLSILTLYRSKLIKGDPALEAAIKAGYKTEIMGRLHTRPQQSTHSGLAMPEQPTTADGRIIPLSAFAPTRQEVADRLSAMNAKTRADVNHA